MLKVNKNIQLLCLAFPEIINVTQEWRWMDKILVPSMSLNKYFP